MRILIIKFGALGDIIIASAVIKQIQNHHHDDDVFLLTTPEFRSLLEGWQGLQIQCHSRSGVRKMIRTLAWIRHHRFDRIYDLQSNDRSALICALSGVTFRAGNHPRFPYTHHPDDEYQGQCHAFDRLNMIIESAGLPKAETIPTIPEMSAASNRIDQWLQQRDIDNNSYILMHAGSSVNHKQKRWPYFSDLANTIRQYNKTIIWIGAREDKDVNQQLSKQCGIDATDKFSIQELVALGRRAAFAVTNDSAPMHILSCAGIPIFSLFGPTNPARNHPLGQCDRVLYAGGKFPESDNNFGPADLTLMPVEQVMAKIQREALL